MNNHLFTPENRNRSLMSVDHFSDADLLDFYYDMLLIREAENRISNSVTKGLIRCPAHLAIGQEAVPVGLSKNLQNSDAVYGAHRSHGHYLALNNDTKSLFAESLGKVNGCSRGMGGSMHLTDVKSGFIGSVPIVGATIPIAVGAALTFKNRRKPNVAVSYFGDGACEEGVFHESLNLASMLSAPVIFAVENNLYASHMHVSERQPLNSVARYAKPHNIESIVIDGNDVTNIAHETKGIIESIRKNPRPFLVEFVTYRWKGHVGPSDDVDVGVERKGNLEGWKTLDPIARLYDEIMLRGIVSEEEVQALHVRIAAKIADDWLYAESASFPEKSQLLNAVYNAN